MCCLDYSCLEDFLRQHLLIAVPEIGLECLEHPLSLADAEVGDDRLARFY